MSAATQAISPPSKILMLLEGRRALSEFGAFLACAPALAFGSKGRWPSGVGDTGLDGR